MKALSDGLRQAGTSLLAALAAILLVVLIILLSSPVPETALRAFFFRPWANAYLLGNLLDTAVITGLAALGFAFGRRSGVFNLGGEGFMYGGAVLTALLAPALAGWGLAGLVVFWLVMAAAGGLTGLVAHVLRSRLQIHEIISTYLLALACLGLGDALLTGPLRDPAGNLLSSPALSADLLLPALAPPSSLNAGLLAFVVLSVALALYLGRTRQGFELRVLAANPELARSQGIKAARHQLGGLAVSGALAFLAGNLLVSGSHHAAFTGISGGLGWNGMAAAMLARNSPAGIVAAALFLAWIQAGFKSVTLFAGLGLDSSQILQGLVILLVSIGMAKGQRP